MFFNSLPKESPSLQGGVVDSPLFFNLLEDDGSIPQLVHSDPVSRQQMQSVSYSKGKKNPAIGINIGNQLIHQRNVLFLVYKRLILR
jgi:hypothetical protein